MDSSSPISTNTNPPRLPAEGAQWLKVISGRRAINASHFSVKISRKPISRRASAAPFPRYCGCASCRGVCRCPLHVTPRSLGYWRIDIYMDERTVSHMITDVHIVDYSDRNKFKSLLSAYQRFHGSPNVVLELVLVDGATNK
jgi:hypothetical protein